MKRQSYFGFDIAIFGSALALVIIGILFIYSSGLSSTGEIVSNEYIKQIIWAVIGLILLFAVLATDYSFFRNIALYLYAGSLLLLLITLIFGKEVNGAKSWLGFLDFGIQPSEFTKISTILFLAYCYEHYEKKITSLKVFFIGMAICAAPTLLIIIQPDMGTALVYIPLFLIVSFIAGIRKRYLFYLIILMVLVIIFTLLPAWEQYIFRSKIAFVRLLDDSGYLKYFLLSVLVIFALSLAGYLIYRKTYFYWLVYSFSSVLISLIGAIGARGFLKDYQLMRLIVFLDPTIDELGTGWNITQSITAVGNGGLLGRGFLQGTQSHYKFLPQQSTDFIFSIIGEEWGFFGSLIVMLLFMVILVRILMILNSLKDSFSVCIAAGMFAMFSFHMFINIGMAIGIMPITGIPLFFLSYGGSSLWTALIGIGFVLNIYLRRYKY